MQQLLRLDKLWSWAIQDPHLEPEGETQDPHLDPVGDTNPHLEREGETQDLTWSLRKKKTQDPHCSLRKGYKTLTWCLRETQDPPGD